MSSERPNTLLAVLSCGPTTESWPIEVAWSSASEGIRTMLLQPASGWSLSSWDKGYEAKHKLPLEQLLSEGKPPIEACLVLNAALGGQTVGVLHPETDCVWLYKLYKAGHVEPNYRLVGVDGGDDGEVVRPAHMLEGLQEGEPRAQTG
ncbi:hypothetical protein [Parvularcula maris]|uniref:Uncharacterized protein n=1 Tax=Parvularcula maris TaxID=2965077 RepID=A0A9X2L8P6_9PROT|nr:hypothetical protein [Parvularcula maris]MCQ8185110.1 hypothetical protein [Parvularcula maris]